MEVTNEWKFQIFKGYFFNNIPMKLSPLGYLKNIVKGVSKKIRKIYFYRNSFFLITTC